MPCSWSLSVVRNVARTCSRFWRTCSAAAGCKRACWKWRNITTISTASVRSTGKRVSCWSLSSGNLAAAGLQLPVFWGNRNWHPLLTDTLRAMAQQGIRRALAYVASAYSSYSGCRQYLENIEDTHRAVGPQAPVVDKLRVFFNHPGFIAAQVDRVRSALANCRPAP